MTTTTQIAGVAGALAVVASTAVVLGAKKLGVFRKVVWAEGPMDDLEFVYVEHKGPYKNIGAAFKRLEKELKEKGVAVSDKTYTFVGAVLLRKRPCHDRLDKIPACLSVGVYKDDPKTVPAAELESLAGVVLDAESAQLSGLPSKHYASQTTLQTVFPYYGYISVILSVLKCYPALAKACAANEENKYGECIELYEQDARTITLHAVKL